jgi:NAD(P)H dehydrogenase (quinone)
MNILVVFAHPMRDSFTGEVLDNFTRGARDTGHVVELADLYREKFDPLLNATELTAQFEGRALPDDILAEQARYERCNAMVLIFPVWWWSVPAMLKGWIDRVFSAGWAYPVGEKDPSTTMLASAQRKNMILCCAGGSPDLYETQGADPTVERQLARAVFGYFGADSATVHIFHGARTSVDISPRGKARRREHLERAYAIGKDF